MNACAHTHTHTRKKEHVAYCMCSSAHMHICMPHGTQVVGIKSEEKHGYWAMQVSLDYKTAADAPPFLLAAIIYLFK